MPQFKILGPLEVLDKGCLCAPLPRKVRSWSPAAGSTKSLACPGSPSPSPDPRRTPGAPFITAAEVVPVPDTLMTYRFVACVVPSEARRPARPWLPDSSQRSTRHWADSLDREPYSFSTGLATT